jgi:hypothetical protein
MPMITKSDDTKRSDGSRPKGTCWQMIEEYIKSIKYGSVTIYIQDGKIIQLEKNEKVRFD